MARQNVDFEVPLQQQEQLEEGAPPLVLKTGSLVFLRFVRPAQPLQQPQGGPAAGDALQPGQQGPHTTADKPQPDESSVQGGGEQQPAGEPQQQPQHQPQQQQQPQQQSHEPPQRACYDPSGRLLGAVPEAARKRLASFGEEVQGSIRSIMRPAGGEATALLVRVQVVGGQPVALQQQQGSGALGSRACIHAWNSRALGSFGLAGVHAHTVTGITHARTLAHMHTRMHACTRPCAGTSAQQPAAGNVQETGGQTAYEVNDDGFQLRRAQLEQLGGLRGRVVQ